MLRTILTLLISLPLLSYAQHRLEFKVVGHDGEPVQGVVITSDKLSSVSTDAAGIAVFSQLAAGEYEFLISKEGFAELKKNITIPYSGGVLTIELEEEDHHGHEEEEVIVQATRTSRTIENSPTRVEVISGEELEEKGNMKPGDIRMLLNESTGIQVQQTSAASFNASIRIQGLQGRYTQLLRDGFPLYGGYSGGFSLLQIVPLDLKQVEVIKGSSSTLYGGGAIAGLVNLVSRTPGEERQLNFMANATTGGGLDLSGYYSRSFSKWGTTFFASRNSNQEYDPGKIGITAIPRFQRITINPKIFYTGNKIQFDAGVNYANEYRLGGSLSYLKDQTLNEYFEKNLTDRITVQSRLTGILTDHSFLQLKASFQHFDRALSTNTTRFAGLQRSVYSEATWNRNGERAQWIIGANYLTDDFEEEQPNPIALDYSLSTIGGFVQNTLNVSKKMTLETGLRGDQVKDYGFEWLPRISLMYRVTPSVTTRIGGGLGYRTPTIFNEETERQHYRYLDPVNTEASKNERSSGLNADINFSFRTGSVQWNINQLFYYTAIHDPLQLYATSFMRYEYRNADGTIETKGSETNLKAIFGNFKLFVGYTFTDANRYVFGNSYAESLTARHRLNNVLMYEIEEKLKLGLEAYYTGKQHLPYGSKARSYWVTGFMAEKIWEKFSVFINFENFTDTRQSKWEGIYSGTIQDPIFKEIYAPLDGFVTNGGVKIRF